MFRVLLTVAMLVQVATCSVNCALATTPPAASTQPAKQSCSCCCAKNSPESVPSDQEEKDDCGVCFCNSGANLSVHCDLSLVLDSQAIWTVVDRHQPLPAASVSTAQPTPWWSGDGTGIALRLAVQSLLL